MTKTEEQQSPAENKQSNNRRSISSLIFHLHPSKINAKSLELNRTFGLGGMAVLLILIQFITGILLRFHYEPFPAAAFESILTINNQVLFGAFIRNIHHWSGVFLVIIAFLHLFRTFFTGAYTSSRKLNWIIGIFLLFFVILGNFTGYLLPWDQLAYWAITVSTGIIEYIPAIGEYLRLLILRGNDVNGDTLMFFYNVHTSFLPFILFVTMLFHFWQVRKAGGIMIPISEEKQLVPTVPNLVYREMVVGLVLIGFIFLLSAFWYAPLMEKANPGYSPNPVKAPWYFAGFQELLLHFHPLFAAFIIPLCVIIYLFLLPYLKINESPTGEWFHSKIGMKTTINAAFLGILFTVLLVILNEFVFTEGLQFMGIPAIITNGLFPFIGVLGIIWIIQFYFSKKYGTSQFENIQAITAFIFTSFIILTIINIFFRGENMALSISILFT